MGKLVLVPTPLNDREVLHPQSLQTLKKAVEEGAFLVVEEHKAARRRWLHWGLPREAIDRFILLNEHDQGEKKAFLLKKLREKKEVYLLSDCGLPTFADPGTSLVRQCREEGIAVHSTYFANSLLLTLALSGFSSGPFYYAGFPPREAVARTQFFQQLASRSETFLFLETPYRFKKTIQEMAIFKNRPSYIAVDLFGSEETHYWGSSEEMAQQCRPHKLPFVVCVEER